MVGVIELSTISLLDEDNGVISLHDEDDGVIHRIRIYALTFI